MRKAFLFLVVCVFLICSTAVAETAVAQGLSVAYDENPSTGYLWEVVSADESIVKVTDAGYQQAADSEDLCGAGGRHSWLLQGVSEGQTTIVFALKRPNADPDSTITYDVKVDSNLTVAVLAISTQDESNEASSLTISLVENPSTGYTWEYTASTEGLVQDICDPDASFVAGDTESVGTPGVHTWIFKGLAAGDVTLVFVNAQHFDETGEPYATIQYTLRVDETGCVSFIGMEGNPEDLLLTSME